MCAHSPSNEYELASLFGEPPRACSSNASRSTRDKHHFPFDFHRLIPRVSHASIGRCESQSKSKPDEGQGQQLPRSRLCRLLPLLRSKRREFQTRGARYPRGRASYSTIHPQCTAEHGLRPGGVDVSVHSVGFSIFDSLLNGILNMNRRAACALSLGGHTWECTVTSETSYMQYLCDVQ